MGKAPHRYLWTDATRAECYSAYIAGTLTEWCEARGLDRHDTDNIARRWAHKHGLPRLRERAPLDGADLTRPTRAIAREYGVTMSAVQKARAKAGIRPPPLPPKRADVLLSVPTDEIARTSSRILARRYDVRLEHIARERDRRGIAGTRPDLLVRQPQPEVPPVGQMEAQTRTEEEEIARGAPDYLRIGPKGYALDTRSPCAAQLLEVPAFDPDAEPDPRWLARWEARDRRRLGTYGETL